MIPVQIYTAFNHTHGLPTYETDGAACMDVRANARVLLEPKDTKVIPTGIYVAVPQGYELQVVPRSGLSLKTALRIANAPGCVDADYRGEVGIIVTNTHGSVASLIDIGERIAQIKLVEVPRIDWVVVNSKEELGVTDRGAGGFGSTGVK